MDQFSERGLYELTKMQRHFSALWVGSGRFTPKRCDGAFLRTFCWTDSYVINWPSKKSFINLQYNRGRIENVIEFMWILTHEKKGGGKESQLFCLSAPVPGPLNLHSSEVSTDSFKVSWDHSASDINLYRLSWTPFDGGNTKEVSSTKIQKVQHCAKVLSHPPFSIFC